MFGSVLIANRGEIALRIARGCRELGVRTVLAHSAADRDSAAARYVDQTVQIGPPAARQSYLNAAAIISAALQTGADAVHPGYGFLSEDPDFAEACRAHGLAFIGPEPDVLARLGDKALARAFAQDVGLPLLPGSRGVPGSPAAAKTIAESAGFPVIIKAVAGGGGRGMTVVRQPGDFLRAYAETRAAAQAVFGDSRVYVERYLDAARHIEVQIAADGYGNVVHLGTRDCSVQRRRQKLIEESPPPGVPAAVLDRMCALSVQCARAVGYTGVGTFEFVMDADHRFYFMEINCRIQVEHPVTELVTGVDLVREQLMVASGNRLSVRQEDIHCNGAAIECRVNAEDPSRGFLPTPGTVDEFAPPSGPFTRVDTHGYPGMRVTPYYDSLLAKVLTWAPDRDLAIARMQRALGEFRVAGRGVRTTIDCLQETLRDPVFRAGRHTTSFVDQVLTRSARHAEAQDRSA
jgi:acetyl-CoA carboxylase biotin carboxylase subunit